MDKENYGKRPLWQWVLIYAVIGLIVYGFIYYFVIAKKGANNSYSFSPSTVAASTQVSASVTQIQNNL